jgi:type IV pilus assembly protein PilW
MSPSKFPKPRRQAKSLRRHRRLHDGFSIIELLVALAIGMALTVAITLVMMRHDATRRGLTSTNDSQLNANYLSYILDRSLRSAGTGFAQGWRSTYGCLLHASRSGTQVLPHTGTFPAPFASVPSQWRLAPAIIHAGIGAGGSDVIAVASGAAGRGEVASRVVPGSLTPSSLNIPTTVGMRGGDLLLVAEPGLGCMLQQLASPFTGGASQLLTMGGPYASGSIAGVDLSAYSGSASVNQLGNTVGNPPQLQLIGLGAADTLFSLDLLQLDGTDTPRPMASGIATLQAVYGVDTNADGIQDTWVAPTAVGYTAAELLDGSTAARDRLLTIMALRVGAILREDRIERENVSQASLTLFSDLPSDLQVTLSLNADDQRRRHRVLELTVPLRNTIHQVR